VEEGVRRKVNQRRHLKNGSCRQIKAEVESEMNKDG
jgi:hypothetical protein